MDVWLPLKCPLLGSWPTTQARALDWELNQRPLGSQARTQPTLGHNRLARLEGFRVIFMHPFATVTDGKTLNGPLWGTIDWQEPFNGCLHGSEFHKN